MLKKLKHIFLLLISFTALSASALKPKPERNQDLIRPIYDLVHENLRPEDNEFYLSSIYGTKENPRALIKRSINKRSGALYNKAIAYTIGDEIAKDLVISEIDFIHREVMVRQRFTGDLYALKLSYGKAKSRLIKKPRPEEKDKKQEKETEGQEKTELEVSTEAKEKPTAEKLETSQETSQKPVQAMF